VLKACKGNESSTPGGKIWILHETPGFFGHPELDTKDLVGQVLNAGTDSSSGSTSFKYGQICCTGCTNWSKSLYMLGESWRAV